MKGGLQNICSLTPLSSDLKNPEVEESNPHHSRCSSGRVRLGHTIHSASASALQKGVAWWDTLENEDGHTARLAEHSD